MATWSKRITEVEAAYMREQNAKLTSDVVKLQNENNELRTKIIGLEKQLSWPKCSPPQKPKVGPAYFHLSHD